MTENNNSTGKALKDFLAESEEIINQLGLDLMTLGDCAERGECDPDVVNSIFRSAHSLKGLAGMFGFSEISDLAHNLENLLDLLRLGKIPITQSTVNVLFDSMEILGTLVRSAGTDDAASIDIKAAVERIDLCISGSRQAVETSPLESLGLSEKVLHSLTEYEEHRLKANIRANARNSGTASLKRAPARRRSTPGTGSASCPVGRRRSSEAVRTSPSGATRSR